MTKKILLWALLPVCPAFAQHSHVHEEDTPPVVISVLKQEIKDAQLRLALPQGIGAPTKALHFSSAREQELLQVSKDYHDPEVLLKDHTVDNHLQQVSRQHFADVSLNLEGKNYDQLDCYLIRDQYRIKPDNELPGDFVYDNTYFVYKDRQGLTLAEVIYMQCSIGNATTEKRIIKKGATAISMCDLEISPNPAQKNINVTFRSFERGNYTLKITNLEGKVLSTPLNMQMLEAGSHSFNYSLDLAPGFYMISLQSEKTTPVSRKLIIQ